MTPAASETERAAGADLPGVGLQSASLPHACALLAAALLAVLPLVAGVGLFRSGLIGILAAAAACGVCLLTGFLALGITAISQRLHQGVQGILGAMLVRMGVPLAILLLLPEVGGPLVNAGFSGMLMGFYLFTLAVETWLSLRFVSAGKSTAAKAA